jgi:hypothetical protein
MWTQLPIDRASTPIEKPSSFSGPRTSTPKKIISRHRIKKKKKKKKQQQMNLVYDQQKKHFVQIWFL